MTMVESSVSKDMESQDPAEGTKQCNVLYSCACCAPLPYSLGKRDEINQKRHEGFSFGVCRHKTMSLRQYSIMNML